MREALDLILKLAAVVMIGGLFFAQYDNHSPICEPVIAEPVIVERIVYHAPDSCSIETRDAREHFTLLCIENAKPSTIELARLCIDTAKREYCADGVDL